MTRTGHTIRAALATSVAIHAMATAAPAHAAEKRFSIPAQDAVTGIPEFARQADIQILVSESAVKGKTTRAVSGSMSVDKALARLIAETGLLVSSSDGRTYTLAAKEAPGESLAAAGGRNRGSSYGRASLFSGKDRAGGAAADEGGAGQEIVVTGTNIRGTPPVGQNLITINRGEIQRSGYATVQEVIDSLPQNYGGTQNELTAVVGLGGRTGNATYGSSVNLRGLGADSTLVLLNGRRLAPAGQGTFVDISAIPLNMIERIEVVPDGASAVYGSDAVGGVVNMILRRRFTGAETTARLGFWKGSGDAPERQVSQVIGRAWTGGNLLVGYEYYDRQSLAATERRQTANSDLRSLGGNNYSSTQSNPGNITAIGGTPAQFAIPPGQNGLALTQGQLLVGQQNFQNAQAFADLLPEQRRHSFVGSFRQEITPSLELYIDGLYSDRDARARDVRIGTNLIVPSTNAYRVLNNLFPGQGNLTIAYNLTRDLGPNILDTSSEAFSLTGGLVLRPASGWTIEAAATSSDLREVSRSLSEDATALQAALASSSLATAFNPFGDGSNTNNAVLQGISRRLRTVADTGVTSATVKADGTLFTMPGGMARIAFGGEYRRERYDTISRTASGGGAETISSNDPERRREVWAAFAEILLPLASDGEGWLGLHALEISGSARYEDYSDVGHTFNPRIGVRVAPVADLSFNASYGTSFKAPFLFELGQASFGQLAPIPAFIDPAATGGSTLTVITFGGNSALQPERSRNWTVGLSWTPSAVPSLRVGVSYFNVHFRDKITTIDSGPRVFGAPELFGDALIRNPTQAQVDARIASVNTFFGLPPAPGTVEALLDLRLGNRALVQVSGLDATLEYALRLLGGTANFSMNASYLFEYDEQFTAAAPVAHNVATLDRPTDLRVRAGAAWRRDVFGIATYLNYVNGYRNTLVTPAQSISSWTTVDAQVSYATGERGWLSNTEFSLSVQNLFDQAPPFANNPRGWGFDAANANPLGRIIAVRVSHKW